MEKRVLSIQSHVVSGYVGNKCAAFALQVLGYDVDIINSVQFSNHGGYKVVKGSRLSGDELAELIDGLSQNGLDTYSHVLTGFVGNVSCLAEIVNVVRNFKKKYPDLIYVCDPVLGDNDTLYLPQEFVPIYRDMIIPLADIILPNKYELQWLINNEVHNLSELLEGCDKLHNKGCRTVVVTSAEFTDGLLSIVASHKTGDNMKRVVIEVKKQPCYVTGTGDLFSALFLAWMDKFGNDIVLSLETTVNSIYAVISKTWHHSSDQLAHSPEKKLELKLIQCKNEIEQPSNRVYKARLL